MNTRTKEQIDEEIAALKAERESLEEWPREGADCYHLMSDGHITQITYFLFSCWKKELAYFSIFRTQADAELAKEYRLMDASYAAGLIEGREWSDKIRDRYFEMMTRTYGKK